MEISVVHLQILSAILFALGLAAALGRRNLFFVLMGVELMPDLLAQQLEKS